MDEIHLRKEIILAIHKTNEEKLKREDENDSIITFSGRSLEDALGRDLSKYEQSINHVLKEMVRTGILSQSGSPPTYTTTERYQKVYDSMQTASF